MKFSRIKLVNFWPGDSIAHRDLSFLWPLIDVIVSRSLRQNLIQCELVRRMLTLDQAEQFVFAEQLRTLFLIQREIR